MGFEASARHAEEQLVARLKRGDDEAFEEMVRDNSARLLAVAQRILRDEDLARDAVQDAFLNACRAITGFNADARLSTWLHRITVNSALALIRHRNRRPEVFLDDERASGREAPAFDEASLRAHEEGSESADDQVASRQEKELLWHCLAGLKENHRRVLALRYLREYDTAKTARILGVAPNTVKTRLLRARTAMRALIERDARVSAALTRHAA
jgi:RNA polymerase sigma-70 factor (ECF subfamily)